ncbi:MULTISPECIES: hypothetical protein [Nocardia]|uniref:hypothetical protein n=1 Tax=Nocardia TaxID=1817 RepID=UPI001C4EB4FB|nr:MULTISPECIES: hypothetical protein [Nocardia]
MKASLAAMAGLALISLAQLPLAAPAAADCPPYPPTCAPSSSEQAEHIIANLLGALTSGSATG